MPPAPFSEFVTYVLEVLAPLGQEVRARRMFGGYGLSCDGLTFALVADEVLYLKAELKYVTIHTGEREYLIEESLARLEEEFGILFIRIHRNCLVARERIRGFERVAGDDAEASWAVVLEGSQERLAVSRRQWPQVKALAKKA